MSVSVCFFAGVLVGLVLASGLLLLLGALLPHGGPYD